MNIFGGVKNERNLRQSTQFWVYIRRFVSLISELGVILPEKIRKENQLLK
jgi:hypothetical protein